MDSKSLRSRQAMLRLVVAGLLAAHGWARLIAGGVAPFGEWLDSQHVPLGFTVAAGVTAYEIVGTLLLALGRWVTWVALGFIAIYATGLVMVHLPAGWFVVGAGRNGMEYSVLLIACLAMLAYVHAPTKGHENGDSHFSTRRHQLSKAVRKSDCPGWEPERPGAETRYGCFLPDLTGFARAPSARLPGAI